MNSRNKTYDIVYIGFFAVLMGICSWISIPMAVPFTMQTFGVFVTVGILGGKRGMAAVLVYILLGIAGIPVFSGMRGGIGVLLNTTGGYIVGFLFSALAMWGMEKMLGRKGAMLLVSMAVGLVICYVFGTAWFMVVYMKSNEAVGIGTVLGWCVIPFIVPDLAKIGLAYILTRRLRQYVPQ